jgi:tRNA 2-thiouridine synthesizing protein A
MEDLEAIVPGNETPADTLDAIGLLCPEPLFQARTAIDALKPGEVLEVLADDPAAEEDLTRFAKRAGHEMVAVEDDGGYKRFLIRRGE